MKIKDLEEDSIEEEMLRKHPILWEYKDIFPKEILCMPPIREFDLSIDLVLGLEPISRTPYRMTTIEMEELKVQLNELSEKGLSNVSHHHGEHHSCFSRKRMGHWGFE